jgi:hypothetical protein
MKTQFVTFKKVTCASFLSHDVAKRNDLNSILNNVSSFDVIAANDLAKEKKLNFGDEIAFLLRLAKKKRWNQLEEKRIAEEIELQSYLNNLIAQDRERQLSEVRQSGAETFEPEQKVHAKCDQHIQDLNEMFAQLDIRRKVRPH